MPLYQYSCRSCGQAFERRLRMSRASDVQTCPSCGSQETRKLISAFALGGVTKRSTDAITPAPANPFS